MRFRAIVREDDANMVAGTGSGAVETAWQTIVFECPELERLMSAPRGGYQIRQIVGIEVIPDDPS